MKKQHVPDGILDLMITYLSDNATEDQVVMLENWVLEEPGNKAAFVDFKKTWLLTSLSETTDKSQVDQEWNKIRGQIKDSGKVVSMDTKRSSRRTWLSIAAGIAMLIGGSLWFINPFDTNQTVEYLTEDSSRIETLSDGSIVHLNKSSSYYYNAPQSDSETRNSQLTGNAFFDIKRDEKHPFEIVAGNMSITVLGTSFYVDARPDQNQSQVIVSSGRVSVKVGMEEVILEKGESATFNKSSKQLVKATNKDENYLGWTTNTLNFENSTLKEVVFSLNRHYNANITIENEALNNCRITAQYKDKTLESVISIIEATLGIQASSSGKLIVLKGSDC